MHKISRTSLAAIVCPSAPFLAPRLLRAAVSIAVHPARGATPSAAPQKSCYATEAKSKGTRLSGRERWERRAKWLKKSSLAEPDVASDGVAPLLGRLRKAVELRDLPLMMHLYPTLVEARLLNRKDTRCIAQALHVLARQRTKPPNLTQFTENVVADILSGALPPHPYAFVHLLGLYRDLKRFTEGHELWQWLVQQDDTYLSQAAYGAAIELLAHGGKATLPQLEELYSQGLVRFPGTFAAYHLSPDAIVPDRTQPVVVPGVPTVLFQGICTARILARDWKNAYLALDTILRLYPTQVPPRFFELFLAERPLSEAYTAVMIACRAGILMSPAQISNLSHDLKNALLSAASMSDRVKLLRAIANALYAYQEAGGTIQDRYISTLLTCFSHLLPSVSPGESFDGDAAQLRTIVVLTAREIMTGLLQAGFPGQLKLWEAMISIAGPLRDPDLLTTTLQDMKAAGAELSPAGTRVAMNSAGLLKNQALIKLLWHKVISTAESEGAQIAFEDWITFTKACRRADLVDYFREQESKLAHTTTAAVQQYLAQKLDFDESLLINSQPSFEYMPVEEFAAEMEGLKEQMNNVEAVIMSGAPLDLKRFPFHMHIDPSATPISSPENLRAVYDEMTTDPHQPPPQPAADGSVPLPALSSTKIAFDELRFLNWLSIVELMNEAEAFEKDLNVKIDQAISAGEPADTQRLLYRPKVLKEPLKTQAEIKERIKALRSPSPTIATRTTPRD
ncbi:hypothetical protein HBI47_096000 [Parastagonospora nodorum]|nr:hypothetical protein HBI47_096000 [Parastagonospora nodorum]